MAETVEFRILGPIEIWHGRRIALHGARQRAVLADLLLHANEVVATERLIDDLWSGEPPKTALKIVHNSVSHLRKLLETSSRGDDGTPALVTRAGGYMLRIDPDQLDANRFQRLVEEGRDALAHGAPEVAAGKLRQALMLWRGAPLADLPDQEFAQAEIARLDDLRLTALEHRIEADLALGRHADIVGEVEALVAHHPLHESFRAYLMLALYRSGRQADALAAYQQARRHLVDELGIEPGPALQRLERAILQQDPSVAADPRAVALHAVPGTTDDAPAREQPAPSARPVRKAVTVLCAEVAAEGRELDPEALERVSLESFKRLGHVVEHHGGTVHARAGGGVVAFFGIPSLHEDDALRAARAASDVHLAARRVSEELSRGWGVALRVRIGVSTGETISGGGVPSAAVVGGDVAASAAELARAASAGETLVDAATARRIRGSARVAAGGEGSWRVLEVLPDATPIPRRRDTPLVGREWELRQLREALARVIRERTSYLFTVLGTAGIGKSRLADEFVATIGDAATVLRGRCLSYGEGITFWPLREIVRQLDGDDPRRAVAGIVGSDPDAAAIVDAIASATGAGHPGGSPAETSWAVRRLFEAIARARPLVVVFDDLQWAEPTFLDLVEHVAESARDAPVLLVCLARPEFLDDRRSWGGGKLNATSVFLEPLSERQSRLLLERVSDGGLPPDTAMRITDAAEGNPLFLEQMLAMMREEGAPLDAVPVPPTIEALLASRLDRLDPEERLVLDSAAVVGRDFSRSAVLALVPPESHDAVTRHLESLVRRELIRSERSRVAGDYGFRFRHGLVREAAYGAIPKQVRSELHERFADYIETAAEVAHPSEEIVAYHLEHAYRFRVELGAPDEAARRLAARAVERLASAGRAAYTRGDMPAAVSLLGRASELLPEGDVRRLELLVELADALRETGEYGRATAVLDEVSTRAVAAGDRRLEAHALVVRLRMQLFTDANVVTESLRTDARRAVDVLEELHDERGLAKAWELLAWAPWFACRVADAEEALNRSLEYARRSRDSRTEVRSMHLLVGAAVFGPLPVEDGIRRCNETLARFTGQQRVTASTLRALAALEAMQGRFDGARGALRQARAILEDLGLKVTAASLAETQGFVELLAGEPDAAEEALRRGLEGLGRAGVTSTASNLAALLAQALHLQGRDDEALTSIEMAARLPARDDVYGQVQWRAARARVLPRLGELEEAERLAREAVALLEDADVLAVRADALLDLAEVVHRAGRSAEAAERAEEARRLYERKGHVVGAARAAVLARDLR